MFAQLPFPRPIVLMTVLSLTALNGTSSSCVAQEQPVSKPVELQALKAALGVWDAEIEVWPQGPESASMKFKGVETNRAYGDYWIASDFDSEFNGETMKVHSIVGYDLDKKRMVGTIIDHGPYHATMTGVYDHATKTTNWITKAKAPNGDPMVQETSVTQQTPDERILVLSVPGKERDKATKVMEIRFVRRK